MKNRIGTLYFFCLCYCIACTVDIEPAFSLLIPKVSASAASLQSEVMVQNLEIPWEIVFLPDNSLLITERSGNLVWIKNNEEQNRISIKIPRVAAIGEGGLLGLALHPKFSSNHWIYLYHTLNKSGQYSNQVIRYRFDAGSLSEETVILDNIPAARIHNGGRLAFGPDGYLYITTGDAAQPALAQDKNSLAGKILRIKDSGEIPHTNPFQNAIFSYGHRNPQGLAWDDQNQLWSTEHGPIGLDKINLIEMGKNYGWPIVQANESKPDFVAPILHSGQNTWAPSGLSYWNGSLYFGGLRGEALYEYQLQDKKLIAHFEKQYGRIRAVVKEPKQLYLYFSTSNQDGRARGFFPEKDKIVRVRKD